MSYEHIFGYGSLVNRKTHDYAVIRKSRLPGWRRVWQHTTLREVAFLNVVPAPGHSIEGVVLEVPASAPELQQREYAYQRQAAADDSAPVSVFCIPAQSRSAPQEHKLLLSYVDVVVQGFFQNFGAEGVQRFFASTDGWDAPVIDDRIAPRYPRHQSVSQQERALTDEWLANIGAHLIKDHTA